MLAQTPIKHERVAHPIAGINHFSCTYGGRQRCGGTLSIPISLDLWAQIKTHGSRTFTPVCPQCKRRTIVHIG